jgi:integrase
MRGKITKRSVDALAPGAGGAEAVLWDSEVKGFGVRVQRGGSKSYILHYRGGIGRGATLHKLTIGRHGSPWTAETARAEAKRLLAEVAAGRDPATARQAERNALMFGDLIDLYLAEGVGHKKASTLKADRGRMEHHLRPLLGKLRAERIGRAEIERMRNSVEMGKTAEKIEDGEKRKAGSIAVGGEGAAAQCVALVSSIYAFAIGRGLCPDNPARGVKKAPVRKVERFLSEAEIARLAKALDAEAQKSGNPYPSAAIKLLLLTGCRKGEILNLRWEHVDFERECLRLPDSKTGAKVVYLNAPARTLLQGLPRMAADSRVIPPLRGASVVPAIDKVWSRVRKAAKLADVRLHDLRHSFASVGAAGGLSLPIIGALLGHKHAATTQRYAHLSADPLRAANDTVGARIASAMNPKPKRKRSAKVIALSSRKRTASRSASR